MTTHTVDLGDELIVFSRSFIVTGFTEEMGSPAKLIVKQPVELASRDRMAIINRRRRENYDTALRAFQKEPDDHTTT